MREYEFTIAVRVRADDEAAAREKLNRLVPVSFRFKYVIEPEDESGEAGA